MLRFLFFILLSFLIRPAVAQTTCAPGSNGVPCDDGNPCTINDTCRNGVCMGIFRVCNDGNPCTTDICDVVTGNCISINNSNPCNDGNPCTVNDICNGGVCTSGAPRNCNDNNPCTTDVCDQATGNCIFTFNTNLCNDNNSCTINDKCLNGVCAGTPVSGTVRTVTSRLDNLSPGCFRYEVATACENDIIAFSVDTVFLNNPVTIVKNITIDGNGPAATVISGNNATRLLTIPSAVNLTLTDISLINGFSTANGGAFFNQGSVLIKDVTLKNHFEGAIPKAFSGSGSITILVAGSLQILQ